MSEDCKVSGLRLSCCRQAGGLRERAGHGWNKVESYVQLKEYLKGEDNVLEQALEELRKQILSHQR